MKAPKSPDPIQTATAQSALNRDTAVTQYGLNATNQVGPDGSLTYSRNPDVWHTSQFGDTYNSSGERGFWDPSYTATTTLSPAQQDIYNRQNALESTLLGTANTQAGRLNTLLSKPFSLDNDAVESRLMELGRKRLDPELDRRRASTEQDLFNRGVRPGSEAYTNSMDALTRGENDAYNQLLLTGHEQGVQDLIRGRELPINEVLALASGGQVQYPQFQNTPGSQLSNVDYTGLVNQQYQQKLANYQAGMSGLFGLGGALLKAIPFSDERLKDDIRRVGKTDEGRPIYTYRYKGSPMMQMGVMAQENPDLAVPDPSGYLRVDYTRL